MGISIEILEDGMHGTVCAKIDFLVAGSILYYRIEKVIIVKKTDVRAVYRNKGVGSLLFYMLVECARLEKLKIAPHCMFAIEKFRKDISLQDVHFGSWDKGLSLISEIS